MLCCAAAAGSRLLLLLLLWVTCCSVPQGLLLRPGCCGAALAFPPSLLLLGTFLLGFLRGFLTPAAAACVAGDGGGWGGTCWIG